MPLKKPGDLFNSNKNAPKESSIDLNGNIPNIKEELKKKTNDAFLKGIFGAPSFLVNNKVFWGQDRLEFVINEAKK